MEEVFESYYTGYINNGQLFKKKVQNYYQLRKISKQKMIKKLNNLSLIVSNSKKTLNSFFNN